MRGVRNLGEIQGSNFSSIAGFGFNWRDDLRVVPYFRRDGAVREEQVKWESVLRSSVEAG